MVVHGAVLHDPRRRRGDLASSMTTGFRDASRRRSRPRTTQGASPPSGDRRGAATRPARTGSLVGDIGLDMSKGKDFRPRKRGFDDDGPMSYDSKPRQSRGISAAPPDGGFGGPPMGGALGADEFERARGRRGREMVQGRQGLRLRRAGQRPGRRVPARQCAAGRRATRRCPTGAKLASWSAPAPRARR